jgi:DNA-binding NtrC family response regulator
MMEEHGYAVIEACDGKAALECAAANLGKIDLVLTDVVMRGMSGPELVLRLTDVDPNLKFIYMSGYAAELISNSGAEGAFTLLEKPFTRSSLLKTLDHVLA